MKKCNLLFVLIFLIPCTTSAQQLYWVQYQAKTTSLAEAPIFFSDKAVSNRVQHNIPWDNTDLPIDTEAAQWSEQLGEVIVHSRWFNASLIYSNEVLSNLELPAFVRCIKSYRQQSTMELSVFAETDAKPTQLLAKYQTNSLQADTLKKLGLAGKNIRIAVFDVGFNGIEDHIAFQHIYARNGIIKTKDFIRNKEDKTKGGSHGTAVLSCIAGYFGNQRMGLATDAEFLLARTEHNNREPFAEEAYWLAAAEWADLNGANIISSSLGYTYHRYFPSDMDGRTSLVSRAATMASKKGILVVNAMGNDGDNGWHYVSTPADADSVLSIGGIDPFKNTHINFSSYGPNNNGTLKPNVSAAGYAVCAKPDGNYTHMYGTSFATPLISGLAACVWQQHPEFTNMELKAFLETKGHLAPYFDYAIGYGAPQVFALTKGVKPKYDLKQNELRVSLDPNTKQYDGLQSNLHCNNAVYVAISNAEGKLTHYFTYQLTDPVNSIYLPALPAGGALKLSFQGNYETIKIP
jgi:serine protease AprX